MMMLINTATLVVQGTVLRASGAFANQFADWSIGLGCLGFALGFRGFLGFRV